MDASNTITPSTPLVAAKSISAPQSKAVSEEQWPVVLRGGKRVLIRPIRKEDLALERRFIEALSPRSRRLRFLDTFKSPSPQLLEQLVEIDPSRDVALIAVIAGETGEQEIGVARLCGALDGKSCEFAVVVGDAWQRKGLGTHLMRHLMKAAYSRGIETIHSVDAGNNDLMRGFAVQLGMSRATDPNDPTQVIHSVTIVDQAQSADAVKQ